MDIMQPTIAGETKEEILETLAIFKNELNKALRSNAVSHMLIQKIIDWVRDKEWNILFFAGYDAVLRYIQFDGFDRAISRFGVCKIERYRAYAHVQLSKMLKVEDNADGIINVIAHEVLHGLLPWKAHHGQIFISAMEKINEILGTEIVVKGIRGKYQSPQYKYELYCPDCNHTFDKFVRACKTVKYPERYCCGHCHTPLKIRKI